MSNQRNNKLVKLSGFIIWFFDCQEPEPEPDSEKWPDIRPKAHTTGPPVHP